MSSQALCSSKITTGAHSLVGRGFLPWAEFNCFVGLDAVVRFLAWGPRAALLCWGTHMWIAAGRAGSDRMAVPDLGARYGWSRDRSSRQPWLPGPVAPKTHGPLLVQGRIATGIAACALAERQEHKRARARRQERLGAALFFSRYLLGAPGRVPVRVRSPQRGCRHRRTST